MPRNFPFLLAGCLIFAIFSAFASPLPIQDLKTSNSSKELLQKAAWQRCRIGPVVDVEQNRHNIDTPKGSEEAPAHNYHCEAQVEAAKGSLETHDILDLENRVPDHETTGSDQSFNNSQSFARRGLETSTGWLMHSDSWHVTSITLINGTPFRLKRIYSSEYQAPIWEKTWPKTILPGQAFTVEVPNTAGPNGIQVEDTAAEVEYKLIGTKKTKSVRIEFKMEEHGKGPAEATLIWKFKQPDCPNPELRDRMERLPTPHGASYLLAGSNEDELLSTAAWEQQGQGQGACSGGERSTVGWMQQLLPEIGHLPLREIVLPRAHHTGLRKGNVEKWGAGTESNAVTQVKTVQEMLRDSGVRVIDTRVAKDGGHFWSAHLTERIAHPSGAIGESIEAIADTINNFLKEHKGELVIWDFHDQSWTSDRGYKRFDDREKAELFRLLERKVQFRAVLDKEGDITTMPLKEIIGDGKSAVIIRFGGAWQADTLTSFPGPSKGFVHTGNFPVASKWSEKRDLDELVADQLQLLEKHRKLRKSRLFDLDWVSSLRGGENVAPPNNESLIDLGRRAMIALRHMLWNELTTSTYPNWITVDVVEGTEMRSLVMAMNRCFAAALCGDWAKKPRRVY